MHKPHKHKIVYKRREHDHGGRSAKHKLRGRKIGKTHPKR